MKQFFVVCVFALALAPAFEARGLYHHKEHDEDSYETSIHPGMCPEPTRLAKPFDLKQFLGTWYEIQSTKPIFEANQRCIQANYKLDSTTGNVVVNNSGVDAGNHTVFSVGTAKPTDQDNVFKVKFFPFSPFAQYWVVDTDYNGYALIVSCNNVFGFFNFRDVWIISRGPRLDAGIVKRLVAKLDSVGIHDTKFIETVQNC